jgi:hypothetical protein
MLEKDLSMYHVLFKSKLIYYICSLFLYLTYVYTWFFRILIKKLKMVCKKLSALTTGVQTYIVKVKVTRLWESVNNKTYELRYDFD